MQGSRKRAAAGLWALAPVVTASIFLGGGASALVPTALTCAATGYTSHVALVVEHADGHTIRRCVGFNGQTITGAQVLKASGLEVGTVTYASLGEAVCQIDAEPASYPPSCLTSTSPYWATFVSRHGGPWTAADHGVSSETFASGDAEGFRYDPQSGSAAAPSSPAGACTTAVQGAGTAARPAASGVNLALVLGLAALAVLAGLTAVLMVRRRPV